MENPELDPLIPPIQFYTVGHLFSKVDSATMPEQFLVPQPTAEFALWEAKPGKHLPPYIIYDIRAEINEATRDACLTQVTKEEFDEILRSIPKAIDTEMRKIAKLWSPNKDDYETLERIILKPRGRLRNIEYLKNKDWKSFIDSLIAFKTEEKDQRLRLVHRAHLFRGLNPYLNPHAIEATNGGTSKSTHYSMHGINIDKATASSFLGFAKSPKEIFPGTIDGTDLPVGVDQIESQSASEIMRYMFSILDCGRATVSSGAARFNVESNSIFGKCDRLRCRQYKEFHFFDRTSIFQSSDSSEIRNNLVRE